MTDSSVSPERSAVSGPVIHQCSVEWWSAGFIAASRLFSRHGTQILFTPSDKGNQTYDEWMQSLYFLGNKWTCFEPESSIGVRWRGSWPTGMVDEKSTCWHTDTHRDLLWPFCQMEITDWLTVACVLLCVCVPLVHTSVDASQAVCQVSSCQFQIAGFSLSCYLNKRLQLRERAVYCIHCRGQGGNTRCTWQQGLQEEEHKCTSHSCSALSQTSDYTCQSGPVPDLVP